jgi:hypothetical protein
MDTILIFVCLTSLCGIVRRLLERYHSRQITAKTTDPDYYGSMGHMEIKIKISINNQDVAPNETTQLLTELLSDLTKKPCDATRFMEGSRKGTRQRGIRKLWADKHMTEFNWNGVSHLLHITGCSRDYRHRGV